MLTTKFFIRTAAASSRSLAIATLLIACVFSQAHAETAASEDQESSTEAKLQTTIANLASIQKTIEQKQNQLRELKDTLTKTKDTSEKQGFEQKTVRLKNDITDLQASFEHITLGGINLSILNDQPEKPINWQEELEQIIRPLLSALKELTAKPRQIDALHREIERLEAQIKVVDKVIDSIRLFIGQILPPTVVKPVNQLLTDWEQRKEDTQRKLEATGDVT